MKMNITGKYQRTGQLEEEWSIWSVKVRTKIDIYEIDSNWKIKDDNSICKECLVTRSFKEIKVALNKAPACSAEILNIIKINN